MSDGDGVMGSQAMGRYYASAFGNTERIVGRRQAEESIILPERVKRPSGTFLLSRAKLDRESQRTQSSGFGCQRMKKGLLPQVGM